MKHGKFTGMLIQGDRSSHPKKTMLQPPDSLALVWDAYVADKQDLECTKAEQILLQTLLHTDSVPQKQLQPTRKVTKQQSLQAGLRHY